MNNQHFSTKEFQNLDYWLIEWLKGKKRKSENTHDAYRRDIRQFIDSCKKEFDQVEVADIQEYQSSLADLYADRTVGRKVAALRSFYKFLNNREVTNINLARIESQSTEQEIDYDRLLTEAEIQAIIEAASDKTHNVFTRLLYLTAGRISEVLGIRWRDLTALEEGGEAYIMGKGRKARKVFIPLPLWEDLLSLRGASEEKAPIFPAISRHTAYRIIKKLAIAANVDKTVTPHSFRHAHISHALKNGATLAQLRDQAGHKNISTTSLYAHVSNEQATATRLKVA